MNITAKARHPIRALQKLVMLTWILATSSQGDDRGEEERYRRRHLAIGRPVPYFDIVREGYALGYDTRLKVPVWVQYELSPEDFVIPPGERKLGRTDDFREDPLLPRAASSRLQDYTEDGNDPGGRADFARGHMVPAADRRRRGHLISETFFLSNMVPQVGQTFNSTVWLAIEEDVRRWVASHGAVMVIVGVAFIPEEEKEGEAFVTYRVIGKSRVAVPTHLYRIILDHRAVRPRALAFLMANEEYPRGTRYENYMVSIDRIEDITGLDFLGALEDSIEEEVEAAKPTTTWWEIEERETRVRAPRQKMPRVTYPILIPTFNTTNGTSGSSLSGNIVPSLEAPIEIPWARIAPAGPGPTNQPVRPR